MDPDTGSTRAMHAFDAVYGTNSSEDCHGHGSHVAAVVGGAYACMLAIAENDTKSDAASVRAMLNHV